jgi:hypothetical protein
MPALLPRSAISLPIVAAASEVAPFLTLDLMSLSSVEAAASVRPVASSMIWA